MDDRRDTFQRSAPVRVRLNIAYHDVSSTRAGTGSQRPTIRDAAVIKRCAQRATDKAGCARNEDALPLVQLVRAFF
jgi:hypothetical protein